MSEDPLGYKTGKSNLYDYTRNSPSNAIDPSGLDEIRFSFFTDDVYYIAEDDRLWLWWHNDMFHWKIGTRIGDDEIRLITGPTIPRDKLLRFARSRYSAPYWAHGANARCGEKFQKRNTLFRLDRLARGTANKKSKALRGPVGFAVGVGESGLEDIEGNIELVTRPWGVVESAYAAASFVGRPYHEVERDLIRAIGRYLDESTDTSRGCGNLTYSAGTLIFAVAKPKNTLDDIARLEKWRRACYVLPDPDLIPPDELRRLHLEEIKRLREIRPEIRIFKKGEKGALRELDIAPYGDFGMPSRVGDKLSGHEIVQHAWLKATGHVQARGTGAVSRGNPSLAVGRALHEKIGIAQQALGLYNPKTLKCLSAEEIVKRNLQALRTAGVPENAIKAMSNEALRHVNALSN